MTASCASIALPARPKACAAAWSLPTPAPSAPVGKTLGRIMDVLGNPIDERGPVDQTLSMPIHRKGPGLHEAEPRRRNCSRPASGHRPDLPVRQGGKIGLFGGAGVGKTVNMMELINNIAKSTGPVGVRRRR